MKSGCYFCHKPEQTRALNREAECSVCLVSGNHLYLLYAAPKSPDFLCDRRGDSSDFSMLVPLCFFFLLPQLLMVPHHHPHHLTTNQQNTFRTYTTSTIKHTGAHFSPLFLESWMCETSSKPVMICTSYLSGHASLPPPLLSKVSREPLHLLTQVIPVNLWPRWLRQAGESLHWPEALSLQCLCSMLDVSFLQHKVKNKKSVNSWLWNSKVGVSWFRNAKYWSPATLHLQRCFQTGGTFS